jgi:hypothetical protein
MFRVSAKFRAGADDPKTEFQFKPNFSSNSHREAVCAQPLGSCDLPVVGPVLGSPSTLTVTDVTTGKTVLERLACRLPPTSGCRWQGA